MSLFGCLEQGVFDSKFIFTSLLIISFIITHNRFKSLIIPPQQAPTVTFRWRCLNKSPAQIRRWWKSWGVCNHSWVVSAFSGWSDAFKHAFAFLGMPRCMRDYKCHRDTIKVKIHLLRDYVNILTPLNLRRKKEYQNNASEYTLVFAVGMRCMEY